jgi:hypothetical protein
MGLEPTTFCMANARGRSHTFATVRSNPLFSPFPIERANASEPERTPNLAILSTGLRRARGCRLRPLLAPASQLMRVPEERWNEARRDGVHRSDALHARVTLPSETGIGAHAREHYQCRSGTAAGASRGTVGRLLNPRRSLSLPSPV